MILLDFREQIEQWRKILEERENAREELLKLTRELRINSTKAVAAIHAGNLEAARTLLDNASKIMDEIFKYRESYPEIYFPITHDATQEFVESYAFFHVIKTGNLDLDFSALKVEVPAILTGLADLVGELRRYVLDLLRKGEFEKAEHLMEMMETIYSNLLTFDFPNKLTPNLRPKVDAARWMIERTKSDFIAAKVASLGDKISNVRE